MIFQRNESFKTYIRFYPVTSFILALNLIVFVIDYLFLDQKWTIEGMYYLEHVFNRYGLNEPWRYVTSIALHAGWDHILFNSFSILVFAPPLERLLGHFRYFVFYLLSGIAGNIMTTIVYAGSDYGSVGASGAIYGLFGSYLFLAIFRKFALDEATRKTIFFMLIFGFVYSIILPNINIWAHIGGAIAGFAMMSIYAASRRKRRNRA